MRPSALTRSRLLRFRIESKIAASAAAVFRFHERPDAFERLQPPWQSTEILLAPTSLEVGTEVILRVTEDEHKIIPAHALKTTKARYLKDRAK